MLGGVFVILASVLLLLRAQNTIKIFAVMVSIQMMQDQNIVLIVNNSCQKLNSHCPFLMFQVI